MAIGFAGRRATWRPDLTRSEIGRPQVGWLVGLDHQVWRIIEVNEYPEDLWTSKHRRLVRARGREVAPVHVFLRPAEHDSPDPVRLRARDRSVSAVPFYTEWWVYADEHYPLCSTCGEPPPCREVFSRAVAQRAMGHIQRYENPSVCPACQEPVTKRQKSITFTGNIVIPAGPPVTYHLRGRCFGSAQTYELEWAQADLGHRRTTLSCPGTLTNHNDNTYECSALGDCRGPKTYHLGGYHTCRCQSCYANGLFGCHPSANATRR